MLFIANSAVVGRDQQHKSALLQPIGGERWESNQFGWSESSEVKVHDEAARCVTIMRNVEGKLLRDLEVGRIATGAA
jgi:hypothetical protein